MQAYKILVLFFLYCITIYSLDAQVTLDSLMRKEAPNSVKELLSPNHIELTVDESIEIEDRSPAFAAYRDNLFMTGIPLNRRITNSSADALFQVSIRQRLTKTVLPFNTFAYLTYTQKSFWQIYEESSPFKDNNYNPGLGIGKYIIHSNKLTGAAFLQLQHESNGRTGDESRSWNFLSLTGKYFLNSWISLRAEAWIPYIDGENNKNLIDYKGYGIFSINVINSSKRWWLSLDITPRKGIGNGNLALGIAYRISKKSYQYTFLQFYNGYSEKLLEYDKYSNYLRIGICLKPDFYSFY